MEKKYNFTYKTTNLINQKYYYGCHSTDEPITDGYIGSGKILYRAIEKYGIENFRCDWIENYRTKEEMFLAEKDILTQKIVEDRQCYNLRPGGSGGGIIGRKITEETRKRMSIAQKGISCSEEAKRKLSEIKTGRTKESNKSVAKMAKTLTGRNQTNHLGINNRIVTMAKGVYVTPVGETISCRLGFYMLGMKHGNFIKYCKYSREIKLTEIIYNKYENFSLFCKRSDIGKTLYSLGFNFRDFYENEKDFVKRKIKESFNAGKEINYIEIFNEFNLKK